MSFHIRLNDILHHTCDILHHEYVLLYVVIFEITPKWREILHGYKKFICHPTIFYITLLRFYVISGHSIHHLLNYYINLIVLILPHTSDIFRYNNTTPYPQPHNLTMRLYWNPEARLTSSLEIDNKKLEFHWIRVSKLFLILIPRDKSSCKRKRNRIY